MSSLDHLAVYLSNGCNLACRYCYVAVNQGPSARLDADAVEAAVTEFCARVPAGRRRITFLGGEPLLDWPLFRAIATRARARAGAEAVLQTFTNGTLLTPAKAAFLRALDVHCTVSLDGLKADNDRHRVYHRASGGSVYDDAMEALRPLDKSRLGVSLVFTAGTVDRLLSNVEAFRRMGFARVTFNPELYESWPEGRLEAMRRVLDGLARWYRSLLDAGVRPPQMQVLFSVLESRARGGARPWWRDCHNMTLGPDGRYYSCDKALSFPIGAAAGLRSGAPGAGMDWAERDRQLGVLAAGVLAREPGREDAFCPLGVVAHARHSGRDPAAALASFRRVADAFAGGLEGLIARCAGHPVFQEIYGGVPVC